MSDSLRFAIPNHADWDYESIDSLCSIVSRGSAPLYVEDSPVMAIGQRCVALSGFESQAARPHSIAAMDGTLSPEAGDVLLNSTGTGTIGRSTVFTGVGRFIVDGHVTLLRPRPQKAEGRWIDSVLRTWWGQNFLETQCYSGSTNQVELSRTRLNAAALPTPPLPEQRCIAEILDTVDEAIRKTEQIIAKLKQVKQGLLHDLLTRGIDDNGELRDPIRHPEQFKDSPLGLIPKTWEARPISNAADLIDPNPSHRYPAVVPIGVPIASTENFIGDNDFDLIFSTHVPSSVFVEQDRRCQFHAQDVVFARKGRIGFARPYGVEQKVFSHTVVLMKPRAARSTHRFLLWSVRAESFFRGIRLRMNTNLGVPTLGVGFLGNVPIAIPPTHEQEKLAAVLDRADERGIAEDVALAKLRLLKRGLMDDLLTGRVRTTPLLKEATA
jgi:type I restriction enzyme, S subunit